MSKTKVLTFLKLTYQRLEEDKNQVKGQMCQMMIILWRKGGQKMLGKSEGVYSLK